MESVLLKKKKKKRKKKERKKKKSKKRRERESSEIYLHYEHQAFSRHQNRKVKSQKQNIMFPRQVPEQQKNGQFQEFLGLEPMS